MSGWALTLDRPLGIDNPGFAPRDVGELDVGQCGASHLEKAPSEELGEGAHWDKEVFSTGAPDGSPGAPIVGIETAAGHEHVNVRVPFESAGPGVEDGEGADLRTQVLGVGGELGEGFEGGAKETIEKRALMSAHETA